MYFVNSRRAQRLPFAGWPLYLHSIHLRCFSQPEMKPPLVLRAESASAAHLLYLLLPVPESTHLGADRATVAARAFQFKLNPMPPRRNGVFVKKQRAALIRKVLESGQSMQSSAEREAEEWELWPRHDEFCHDDEHDEG